MLNNADVDKLAWVYKHCKEIVAALEQALSTGEQRQAFIIRASVDALHAQVSRIHNNAVEPFEACGDA